MTTDWVVLWALIDDLDSNSAGRTALLSSTIAQAGVMSAANDSLTNVYVMALDSNYANSASFSCEPVVEVVEVTGATELAVAAASAVALSLLM